MGIGKNIERLRKLNKLTQSELGKMLNITNKAISSWETDRTEPNIGMIEEMCKIFNCRKSDILDGSFPDKENISSTEYEIEWFRLGGGKHPISLSDEEYALVLTYRDADETTKGMLDRILKYSELMKERKITE